MSILESHMEAFKKFYLSATMRFSPVWSMTSTDAHINPDMLRSLADVGMLIEDPDERGSYWMTREGVNTMRSVYTNTVDQPHEFDLNEFDTVMSRLPLLDINTELTGKTNEFRIETAGRSYALTIFEEDGLAAMMQSSFPFMPYVWWEEKVCEALEARGLAIRGGNGWTLTGDAHYIIALIDGVDSDTLQTIEEAPSPTVKVIAPTLLQEIERVGLREVFSMPTRIFDAHAKAWRNVAVLWDYKSLDVGYETDEPEAIEALRHAGVWQSMAMLFRDGVSREQTTEWVSRLTGVFNEMPQELVELLAGGVLDHWLHRRNS